MAIGDSREELQLVRDQRAANEEFRNATRLLRQASEKNLENSLRQQLGLTKEGVRASIEDKLLGSGMKRIIYNFILDKRRDKNLAKEAGLTNAEFKALKQAEKQRKKEVAQARARQSLREARDNLLRQTLGEEQAAIRIQALNAQDNADIIADAQIQAEASKAQDDKEAADAAKKKAEEEALAAKEEGQINSLTEAANSITAAFTDSDIAASFQSFADSLQTVISASGVEDSVAGQELVAEQIEMLRMEQRGEGESPAERDKQKAEIKAASDKQIDLLQKIADNVSGGGGGDGGDAEGSGDGGGGMLAGLGKGIASLGKGIGVFLKSVGSGAGKLVISLAKGFAALGKALGPIGKGIGRAIAGILQGFAKGVMAFANPLVIGGLAVFTLGMIGLGAALRLAAPAFEAIAPVLIKVADVIGNVLMTAIKEVPAIFKSIGGVITAVGTQIRGIIDSIGNSIMKIGAGIESVLNGIGGVIQSIGDTISGVITSVAEGIATVVNSFKGPSLDEKTAAVERLSEIDPIRMQLTAAGIEAIGEALDSIGGGVKIPFFSKESPVAGILELAKNSGGILAASSAVSQFVKNAELFEKGVEIDDSVIEGIEKVVKALGSGNPAGLSAFDRAINSINGLDASKISLLQGIKIPQITPKTAAEYEKVFNAMQKNQPDLIDKVSSTLSRFFGSSERSGSGGTGGTGGSGGLPAGSPSVSLASASKGAGSADPIESAAKDVSKMSRKQYNNMMVLSKEDAEEYKSLKARQKEGDDSRFVKNKIRMLRKKGQATFQEQNPRETRPSIDIDKISTGKRANLQASEIAANPPAAAASAGGGGGNVSISAPTTNSSQSTSSYPITNRPNNPALDRIRNSLNF